MEGPIRDRLAALSRRELVGLVAMVAVVLAGAGLWYARSLPRPVAIRSDVRPGPPAAVASPSPSVLLVHVAGRVRRPGVYEFQAGDRVVDAVQAAGGPRKGADLDALNLAAPLTDGEQVLVPAQGPPAAPGGGSAPPATPGLLNVNTASESDLEELSGIGPVLGQRIVDYRTEHGPFASVDGLLDVSGIGPATLDEFRDQVTV
ncbi:MAG: helix-hairpin-helix domain-containing protein [Actinomycetota bacterium]|nr:helix-hairpin-helix domain-containing protein [Actinomycetota bacterium]